MESANIGKICLASIAITAILLAMAAAAPAWAQGYSGAGDGRAYSSGHEPKDVYMAISVDGMTDSTATFSVMSMAMKGKDDMAVMITPGAPLKATYNSTSDMGYISTANFLPADMRIDTVNNSSIPVAGASAVLGLHDMKVLTKEKGYMVSQYGAITIILPDGMIKNYKLDRPVKVTYDEDRKIMVIDGYTSYTKLLTDAFRGGATFPSGAPAMPLTSLMTAKSVAAKTVAYERPAYVPPPA